MFKRLSIVASLIGLGLLAASGAARAEGFQTFLGNTSIGAIFDRPDGLCGPDDPNANDENVRYIAQSFELDTAARCFFYSAQNYDGFIHLYSGSFNPALPLTNCIDGDDDGDLGQGTSELGGFDLTAGTYVLVTSAFEAGLQGSFSNTIHCGTAVGINPQVSNIQPLHGHCGADSLGIPDDHEICLHNRFKVAIDGVSDPAPGGLATPVRTGSTDTGLFWFFNDRNWEVMVKVLNACAFDDHWWVFAGALTDRSYTINVVDTTSGAVRTYSNELGKRAAAVADTAAFPCLPGD
jgi:hypothetical protein